MENKRIGFLLLMASPVDNQFIKLLNRLYEFPNTLIVIHHDEYQAELFPKDIKLKYNIKFVEPCYRTYWSHLNNVLATLDGLKLMYDEDTKVDWFITLTPSCYPIKPIVEIQQFYNFCQFDALIDMHRIGRSDQTKDLDKYQIRDFNMQPWFKIPFITKSGGFYWKTIRKQIKIEQHPFFIKNIPYQGSNWFSLNRTVVKEIIEQDLKHGDLVQFYQRYIVSQPDMHPCPQETILQTFVANLPQVRIFYDNFRYINWEGRTDWSPNVLDLKYSNDLMNTTAHWARKFKPGFSDEIIQFVDKKLLV